jgi:hypothetical protein
MTAQSKAWTVFGRSNAGIVGSNPIQGMHICLCVYSVFVLSGVQATAFGLADHSSKESYRLWKNEYETEEEARAQQKGCRAIFGCVNEWNSLGTDSVVKEPIYWSNTPPVHIPCQMNLMHNVIPYSLKIYFNIILPCTPRFPNQSRSFWFYNFNYTKYLICNIQPTWPHLIVFGPIIILTSSWGTNQEVLVTQYSPDTCHFLPLKYKYFPRHPILKYPPCIPLSLWLRDQLSQSHTRTTGVSVNVCILPKFLEHGNELSGSIKCWEILE